MMIVRLSATLVIFLASTLLTLPANADADNSAYLVELGLLAEKKQLWNDPEWLNLLHYQVTKNVIPGSKTRYSSFVDDEAFFLSADGDHDPQSELHATLEGLFQAATLNDDPNASDPNPSDDKASGDNHHPQCHFPARLNWLVEKLAVDRKKLPRTSCPLYQEWSELINAGSVVLVFPAHHLNSPSSMFGHTLLRLDPKPDREHMDWLSYGVNFGANVPPGENSFVYAYQGLSGGYPGQFVVEPYFKKIQEYNRGENRDIWEYPLNLNPEESHRLATHLWELKDINFDYYFFTENCSYRLLELLEVARPGIELTDDFWISAIPIDTIRTVERGGLISSTEYRPAMATQLKHQLAAVPAPQRRMLPELAQHPELINSDNFQQLSEPQQYQALNSAYTGLRYQQAKKTRDANTAQNSLTLLAKLSQYPTQDPLEITTPIAPQNSHQSKRLAINGGRDGHRNYSELEFRMAYHSLLDNSYGFLPGAQINMGNGALRRYDDGSVKLERLDVVDIVSLTPKNTFFDQLSWRVYGGLERVDTAQGRPLATHVTGGGGYAFDLNNTTLFALLMGRLEHNRDFDVVAEIALGPQLGWLYSTRIGNGLITASGLEFSGGEQRLEFKLEQNIVLDVNHALRLSAGRRWFEADSATELSLGYHFFFR
ncbi:MAG: DUF4105 domain-containing protein [Porticoccaceae bacterium]